MLNIIPTSIKAQNLENTRNSLINTFSINLLVNPVDLAFKTLCLTAIPAIFYLLRNRENMMTF